VIRKSHWMNAGLLFLAATVLAGCLVNQQEQHKRDMLSFLQKSMGEYENDSGKLFIAPVYARMIGLDTFYLERTTPRATTGRLVALEISPDGEKIVQYSYVFAEQGRWLDLRRQPELLSALLPQDVRAAGTCDIQLSEDLNSITYTCGGSPPMTYQRVQHAPAETE
jgi:hypothetical protein